MNWTSYVLGVATIPALALALFLLVNGMAFVSRFMAKHGWFMEFGGEDGECHDDQWDRREVRRHLGIIWTGTFFQKEPATLARFIIIAGQNYGIHIGRQVAAKA